MNFKVLSLIPLTRPNFFLPTNQDVEVIDMFGPGGSVLLSNVQCSGTEEAIHLCPSMGIGNHTCGSSSAGVICSRSFGLCK